MPYDRARTQLRIGPAGWSYRDWQGVVHPTRTRPAVDPLQWIARFFDLVEINVSFYRVPPARQSESWSERVRDTQLHFSAKLPRDFTHHGALPTPRALRPFLDFLAPLDRAGRFDVVLAQFPWSLRPGKPALELMRALRDELSPHPVVFELRHRAWASEPWPVRLGESGLETAIVDQPALAQNLGMEFAPREWAHDQFRRRAYVRLHGRNRETWFDPTAGRDARYDWLYSLDDLRAWAVRVRELLRSRASVHVVTNNHFEGQAVVNALEIAALLGRPAAEAPAGLYAHFGGLRERWKSIGFEPALAEAPALPPRSRAHEGQGELFDDAQESSDSGPQTA